MGLDFRKVRIRFDPTRGQVQKETATAVFGTNVRKANAALQSFLMKFSDGDRPIFEQAIDVDVEHVELNTVRISVAFLLRDKSGRIDDRFEGFVDVVVIADVA